MGRLKGKRWEGESGRGKWEKEGKFCSRSVLMGPVGRQVSTSGPAVAKDRPAYL